MITPDLRSARVEAIKKAIGEGQYKINPEEIAEKMIFEIISELIHIPGYPPDDCR